MTPQDEATQRLFRAAQDGNLEQAKAAIDAGADPNATNGCLQTPLHWASEGDRADIVRVMIEKGADVTAKDEDQRTPLHWARHTDIARLLIETLIEQGKGAEIDAKDESYERTPLHWAVVNGDTGLTRLLIAAGVDVNAKDIEEQTPLHLAAGNGHADLVKLLEEADRDKPGHAALVTKNRCNDEPQRGG